MLLDFLKEVQPQAVETRRGGGGVRKERNPEGADLRIFSDGSIYPSAALVKEFSLEYGSKPAEKEKPTGNGFDVINAANFQNYLKTPDGFKGLWITCSPKADSKVDLFSTTKYDENGAPTSSVLDQGSKTYGETVLLDMLKEVYGIECEKGKFIDLVLIGKDGNPGYSAPFFLPPGKNIAFIPKAIARGEKKGTESVSKRDNPQFFLLYPASLLNKEASAEVTEEATA